MSNSSCRTAPKNKKQQCVQGSAETDALAGAVSPRSEREFDIQYHRKIPKQKYYMTDRRCRAKNVQSLPLRAVAYAGATMPGSVLWPLWPSRLINLSPRGRLCYNSACYNRDQRRSRSRDHADRTAEAAPIARRQHTRSHRRRLRRPGRRVNM